MLQLPSEETIRQYLIDNMPDPKLLEGEANEEKMRSGLKIEKPRSGVNN